MAERKHTHGLGVSIRNGVTVISIGDMEIWDGADLSLIRDSLHALITREGRQAIGVDMRHVQYVPSGFFGMLFDWFDRGIQITLFHPRDRVRNMLWFRKFFAIEVTDGTYCLHCGQNVIEEELSEELWSEGETELPEGTLAEASLADEDVPPPSVAESVESESDLSDDCMPAFVN